MPKCLLGTVRRCRTSPVNCHLVETELNGTQSSADGSDNSDCCAGNSRPARKSQRRVVKRKRSLSHLSVVTRFYMHTDQPEEGSRQDGNVKTTDDDNFIDSADIIDSLPTEPDQPAALTKHAKHEVKSHSRKAKCVSLNKEEIKKTSSKAHGKRNEYLMQNMQSARGNCDDTRGQLSHEASHGVLGDCQEGARALLTPASCHQLSALPPAVYVDLETQQCLSAACSSPLLLSASPQTVYCHGPPSFPGSAVSSTLESIMSAPMTDTNILDGSVKKNQEDGDHLQSSDREMPNSLTSGVFVGSQLMPVALVKPVWLQSTPTFISPRKTSSGTEYLENMHKVVHQLPMACSDSLQNKQIECLLQGVKFDPVAKTVGQSSYTLVHDQGSVKAVSCTTSGYNLPEEKLKSEDPIGMQATENLLYLMTAQNAAVTKQAPLHGSSECSSGTSNSFSMHTRGKSVDTQLLSNITEMSANKHISSEKSVLQKTLADRKNEEQSDSTFDSFIQALPEMSVLPPEKKLVSQPSCLSAPSNGQSIASALHTESEKQGKAHGHPLSVLPTVVSSDAHTQNLRLAAQKQSDSDKWLSCSSETIAPPGEICASNLFDSSSLNFCDGASTKETGVAEAHFNTTGNESKKNADIEREYLSEYKMEAENDCLKTQDTDTNNKNVNTKTTPIIPEYQKMGYFTYQDSVQQELQNGNRIKGKFTTASDDSGTSVPDFLAGKTVSSLGVGDIHGQTDCIALKKDTKLNDRSSTEVQSEHSVQKYDDVSNVQNVLHSCDLDSRLHQISTGQENDKVSDNAQATLNSVGPGNIPKLPSRQRDIHQYSSKWISAVAACISAQPSLFSVLHSSNSTVFAPVRPTNLFSNPFLCPVTSLADAGPVPLANLSHNLITMGSHSRILGTVESMATNKCSRENKENLASHEIPTGRWDNNGSVINAVLPPIGKHTGRHSNMQKDCMLFHPSNPRQDDQGTMQGFREMEELGLRPSSQKCPKCSVEFFTHADLLFHMTVHEADPPAENGAILTQRGNQSDADTGEARNKCGVCSRVFTRSWLLKGHMRTHTGERPFRCTWPQCQRAFADKSNLRSHTLIHTTTAKSFTCPKCSRAFSQKRYLHKHMLEVCRII